MDGVDTPQSAEQDSMALDECGPEERDPIATDMLPPKEALPDLRSLLLRYLRTHKRKQAKATFQGFRRVRRLKLQVSSRGYVSCLVVCECMCDTGAQGDRGSSLERGHVQTKQGEAWTVPVCTSKCVVVYGRLPRCFKREWVLRCAGDQPAV